MFVFNTSVKFEYAHYNLASFGNAIYHSFILQPESNGEKRQERLAASSTSRTERQSSSQVSHSVRGNWIEDGPTNLSPVLTSNYQWPGLEICSADN